MNDLPHPNVLAPEVCQEVNKEAAAIRKLTLHVKRDMNEIGCRLNKVASLLPHGQFAKWLSSNTDFSHRTANNLMSSARLVTEHTSLHGINQTALYHIAAPGLDPAVRDRVIARVKSGQVTSTKGVIAIIKEEKGLTARAKQQRSPEEVGGHEDSDLDGAVRAFAAILIEGGLSDDDLDRLQSIARQKNGNLAGLDQVLQERSRRHSARSSGLDGLPPVSEA